MADQAKGATSQIKMGWEAAFKTAVAAADRRPWIVPFNSESVKKTQTQNQSETIRGNMNPVEPYRGDIDVQGDITVPVDHTASGFWLRALLGAATNHSGDSFNWESAWDDDVNAGGTVTITAGDGTATMSISQGDAAVGDRVIYTDTDDTVYEGFLTAGSGTSWTMSQERDGDTAASNTAGAATINAIITNQVDDASRTISISSGTATISDAQADLAVGQMIIFDITGTRRTVYVTAVASTTSCTVVDGMGLEPDDATTKEIDAIETTPYFEHIFKIHATNAIPSFVLDKKISLDTPTYELFTGCKVSSFEIAAGGNNDAELLATIGIMGATSSRSATAYDAGDSPDAANPLDDKFNNSDATAKEGGDTISSLTNMSVRVDRALDPDSRCIGGGGVRRALPEGIVALSGDTSALFEDTTVLDKAENGTESSLQLAFSNGSNSLTFDLPEIKYTESSPVTQTARGVRIDLSHIGYYEDNSDSTALKVTLVTDQELFA